MADVSSEMRHVSPRDSSTASEASNGSLAKGPSYTFSACEPDEDPDFLSLIFPQKLWKVVESDQFKSISWDENGTSIMINEDLFKKEVLDRKAPFRIFETKSMKSFVRQLNLYGFNKMRQNFERSASLPDFLAEEEVVSTLSKILIYHNPNFKRGCPQLLKRMKRRVGIKSAPHVSTAFVPDFSEKHYQAGGNSVSHQNSGSVAETSGIGLFSASTNLNLPLIRKCSTSQRIDDTRMERWPRHNVLTISALLKDTVTATARSIMLEIFLIDPLLTQAGTRVARGWDLTGGEEAEPKRSSQVGPGPALWDRVFLPAQPRGASLPPGLCKNSRK
ncbi:heat shock transcription factor, Y-linked-like [Rhynchocyon petersi]